MIDMKGICIMDLSILTMKKRVFRMSSIELSIIQSLPLVILVFCVLRFFQSLYLLAN